ncbi:hypothetical protein BABINDRAFT_162195 [Babjeviella inositovora NRRL Y-12698]|uniref:Uncharacterized protein n=1 Tax=Babjeviella inositovora NRRL Y-12698 TaxID=984486 RepID=A0A1E3QN77_9ASCO|nr:uncharacterized protein BABINDRAFT_162195 [Babjeviella inositovora NRRL Y-12698]ODQ79133.1 hypothetical protein BABINDRAFT_162195 [Babjeviella inositovora NRRL Y-12698]
MERKTERGDFTKALTSGYTGNKTERDAKDGTEMRGTPKIEEEEFCGWLGNYEIAEWEKVSIICRTHFRSFALASRSTNLP